MLSDGSQATEYGKREFLMILTECYHGTHSVSHWNHIFLERNLGISDDETFLTFWPISGRVPQWSAPWLILFLLDTADIPISEVKVLGILIYDLIIMTRVASHLRPQKHFTLELKRFRNELWTGKYN